MNIPKRTAERLIKIFHFLGRCEKEKVTSVDLEKVLGASQDVIRRDFSLMKIKCGKSNGYDVIQLKKIIADILDLKAEDSGKERKCCIVGLSKIGGVLLDDQIFSGSSFKVVAGFDSNVNRTEILKASFPLHPLSRLKQVVKDEGIEYALLSCDSSEAQQTASLIEESGIKGIINITCSIYSVNIPVVNACPVLALTELAALTA